MKFRAPLFILFILAVFVSCRKDDLPPAVLPVSGLLVANASGEVFNIFQNGNRLNNEASLYPNGLTGYMTVVSGLQNYQFKRMGSPDVLINTPLTLDTLRSYSMYVTGLTLDETFLLNDDFTPDTADVANVRFVNASPENINLDLAVRNIVPKEDTTSVSVTTSITNIAFKSGSAFKGATAGDVELKILRAGSSSVIFTDTVTLQSGQGYTIFAKGRLSQGGDTAFGAGLISNQ
ncbi:MAG: DUF4397 domain-containing protein [Mucilaginibacter sp.]